MPGTKRLANLLHITDWEANAIETYVLSLGEQQVQAAAAQDSGGRALCIFGWRRGGETGGPKLRGALQQRSPDRPSTARPGQRVLSRRLGLIDRGPGLPLDRLPGIGMAPDGRATPSRWGLGTGTPIHRLQGAGPAGVPYQSEQEAQRSVLERITTAWGSDKLLHVWDRGFSGASLLVSSAT